MYCDSARNHVIEVERLHSSVHGAGVHFRLQVCEAYYIQSVLYRQSYRQLEPAKLKQRMQKAAAASGRRKAAALNPRHRNTHKSHTLKRDQPIARLLKQAAGV